MLARGALDIYSKNTLSKINMNLAKKVKYSFIDRQNQ